MHALLTRLFDKKKIKDTKALTIEERSTFDKWDKVLSRGELTIKEIAEFCRGQRSLIEKRWRDLKNERRENERALFLHTVYGILIDVIEGPKAEREALEKYLVGLLDEP